MEYIELRSDILILLTQQMRESILTSQYGDWSAGQDQTVKELQIYAASLFGVEAAAYTPSATFANQCALLTAGRPGEQVIVRDGAHIIQNQNGSPGRLARLMTKTLDCPQGYITAEVVKKCFKKNVDSQTPHNSVLVAEFPTSQGNIPPLQIFHQAAKVGKEAGLHVHVDGARIFSAIAELKIEPSQIMKHCSSLTICLSKGLLAPVGSVIVGSKEFITRFKRNQKLLGGVFRKPGVVAGAALIALKKMRFQLWKDNQMAKTLAQKMSELGWLLITNKVETNIIYFKITDPKIDPSALSAFLKTNGVFCGLSRGVNRFVIHHYIRQSQIQTIINLLTTYQQNLQASQK